MHPSIVEVRCHLPRLTDCQWVLLRGDAHHDNPHSDHEKEREDLEEAVRRDAIILDVGDLFCAMGGRADPRRSRKDSTRKEHQDADDYFDSLVRHAADFYSPYAHRFAMIAHGNHETAILKNQETDLTQRLVERLNAKTGSRIEAGKYGGEVYFHLRQSVGRVSTFWLTYFHGSGGGGMMSFDALRVRRQSSWNPAASVVVCGHVHERWALEIVRKIPYAHRRSFGVRLESQWHIRTGTYKEEYGNGQSGFHVEKGAPPKPLGAMWMRISYDRKYVKGLEINRPRLEFIAT